MLGDVLLITEKHQKAGEAIIQKIVKMGKPKMMVAISGESGSGKSELAHVIAKGLRKHGIIAKPLHIDNYYRIHPLERTEWRKSNGIQNVVGPGEYDWNTISRNVLDFKEGQKSTGPCVDLVTEQIDLLTTDYSGIDMIIIDGLYAIKVPNVDLCVFIELTYHETKKAQVVRGKEPQNEYRMQVLEKEHQEVQALKALADVLINMDYEVRMA
ncbi:MAG: uridine kinase [Bacteroidetes bacterium HGW-Bacteroidetes-1]|jgi:uridine kinase|nr:MAG: uridine kinase [Bacteroidetes bacterium HGW-Bacteroidetes-1]